MESNLARFADPVVRRASITFEHMARSEQTICDAVDLLGRLHWYGSTLAAQMHRQEQLDSLAMSTPALSEVEAIAALVCS